MENPKSIRITIVIIFFVHGLIFGNWVTRIPEVKSKLSLSESELGFLLFAISFGLIVSISFTGGMINKFGSKAVTIVSGIMAALILLLMSIGSTFAMMWIILFLYGSAMTFMDVAMNAQAVEVERKYQQPIMSSFHAAYSIAGFVGAAFGGLMIEVGISALLHFSIITSFVVVIILVMKGNLVEDPVSNINDDQPIFKIPPKSLLPLGIIAMLSSVGEGTMSDWTGIYLIQTLSLEEGRATWGFAIFSLTMTVGRLLGDKITKLFSRKRILQTSGLVSSLGLFIAITTNNLIIILIGFGLVGLGLSVIIPIAFSLAGNKEGFESGVGIASVASIGYLGFLLGPPIVGWIAEITSLSTVFGIIAFSFLVIIMLAEKSVE